MSVDGLGVYGWKAIVRKVGEYGLLVLLDYRIGFRDGLNEWIGNLNHLLQYEVKQRGQSESCPLLCSLCVV